MGLSTARSSARQLTISRAGQGSRKSAALQARCQDTFAISALTRLSEGGTTITVARAAPQDRAIPVRSTFHVAGGLHRSRRASSSTRRHHPRFLSRAFGKAIRSVGPEAGPSTWSGTIEERLKRGKKSFAAEAG